MTIKITGLKNNATAAAVLIISINPSFQNVTLEVFIFNPFKFWSYEAAVQFCLTLTIHLT